MGFALRDVPLGQVQQEHCSSLQQFGSARLIWIMSGRAARLGRMGGSRQPEAMGLVLLGISVFRRVPKAWHSGAFLPIPEELDERLFSYMNVRTSS